MRTLSCHRLHRSERRTRKLWRQRKSKFHSLHFMRVLVRLFESHLSPFNPQIRWGVPRDFFQYNQSLLHRPTQLELCKTQLRRTVRHCRSKWSDFWSGWEWNVRCGVVSGARAGSFWSVITAHLRSDDVVLSVAELDKELEGEQRQREVRKAKVSISRRTWTRMCFTK